jgi:hypothetical protein
MLSEDEVCAEDHVIVISWLPLFIWMIWVAFVGSCLGCGVWLALGAVEANRVFSVRMLLSAIPLAGGAYFGLLLLWRLVSWGRWVRCRDGVVEVSDQWRWVAVGTKGSVQWEVLGFPQGMTHFFLEGDAGRSSFGVRTNERDAISALLAADAHFADAPTKGVAPY